LLLGLWLRGEGLVFVGLRETPVGDLLFFFARVGSVLGHQLLKLLEGLENMDAASSVEAGCL